MKHNKKQPNRTPRKKVTTRDKLKQAIVIAHVLGVGVSIRKSRAKSRGVNK